MKLGVSRLFLGALLSAVLVVTVVTPVAADELEPTPVEVPPLQSEPFEVPQSVTPIGDFTEVVPPAQVRVSKTVDESRRDGLEQTDEGESAFDPSTSKVVERTEFVTTYENSDGSRTDRVGQVPVNAENDQRQWVPVNTFLERNPDQSWSIDDHPLDPVFAQSADEENAFSVSRGGYELGFTLEGAEASQFTKAPGRSPGQRGDPSPHPQLRVRIIRWLRGEPGGGP